MNPSRSLLPRLLFVEFNGRQYSSRQWNFRDWNFLYRRKLTSSYSMIVGLGNGLWDESGHVVNTDHISRESLPMLARAVCVENYYPEPPCEIQGAAGDVLLVKSAGVVLHMKRLTRDQYARKLHASGLEVVVESAVCDAGGLPLFDHQNQYAHLAAAPLIGVGRLAMKLAHEEFGDTSEAA